MDKLKTVSTSDKTLFIIFMILLFQTFYAGMTQTTSDVDIAFRSLLSMIIGYFTSSGFIPSLSTSNPVKPIVIGGISICTCIMLVVARNYLQGANISVNNLISLRDVLSGGVGYLVGKQK